MQNYVTMMVDYRDDNDRFVRMKIDDMEFCVRDGELFFISDNVKYNIPLESVIQVFPN